MATTSIEWTRRVWNFLAGCSFASPGCTNCYAMREAARIERMNPALEHYRGLTRPSKAGPVWTGKVGFAPHKLTEPLRVQKPDFWFVNSMSDLFAEGVPDEWIDRAFAVMALAPQHTFQVLTKRSKRMREYLGHERRPRQVARAAVDLFRERKLPPRTPLDDRWPVRSIGDLDLPDDITMQAWPLPNVWLGVSVEDQARADERIPDLLATPAAVRWISAEPLLGPVDLRGWTGHDWRPAEPGESVPCVNWIVVGGESGPGARPMHPDWARALRDQCQAAGVPFFFKQWGEWAHADQVGADHPVLMRIQSDAAHLGRTDRICVLGDIALGKVGKKAAGRLLDGIEHNAMPESL